MRNLRLKGRIVVFKMFETIWKIVFLALLIKIPYQVVKELEKMQQYFLQKNYTPKIKHETTCKDHQEGDLKNEKSS